MRAKNVTLYGQSAMSYYTGSMTIDKVVASTEYVAPGGLVKGNFGTPNPWSYTVSTVDMWRGSVYEQNRSSPLNPWQYWGTRSGCVSYSANDVPEAVGWDRNLVYNQALERLNESVRGSLDLGVAFAELSSTLKMVNLKSRVKQCIANSTRRRNRVRDLFGRARGGDRAARSELEAIDSAYPKVKEAAKSIANGNLELSYGWLPMMSDIFGTINELASHCISGRMTFRGSSRMDPSGPLSGSRKIDGYPGVPVKREIQGKQCCKIVVCLDVPGSAFSLERFSSLNPISLGYELCPYSFVFDWFVNVGGYLRSLETALIYNKRFVSGYSSELFVCSVVEKTEPTWVQNGIYNRASINALASRKDVKFLRTVLPSYPLPRIPPLQVDLGWRQLLNAASLLTQKL